MKHMYSQTPLAFWCRSTHVPCPFLLFRFVSSDVVTLSCSLPAAPRSGSAWVKHWQCLPFRPADKARDPMGWEADEPVSTDCNEGWWTLTRCIMSVRATGQPCLVKSSSLLHRGRYITGRTFKCPAQRHFRQMLVQAENVFDWCLAGLEEWIRGEVYTQYIHLPSQCNHTQAPSSSVWGHWKTNLEMKGLFLPLIFPALDILEISDKSNQWSSIQTPLIIHEWRELSKVWRCGVWKKWAFKRLGQSNERHYWVSL